MPEIDTTAVLADDAYERRVREQLCQYGSGVDIHDLPEIFHEWSRLFVGPAFRSVFGCETIPDFYVDGFLDSTRRAGGAPIFLSLGCGEGTVENDIARKLRARGLAKFSFVCVDLSPALLAEFAERIPDELRDCFTLRGGDINRQVMGGGFHAIMANHSLHHMVELETILGTAFAALHDQGSFLTNDMIGRNGHQRWPETRLLVDFFWPFLSERQRINLPLQRAETQFLDNDCSTEGFEGIRAQDILPVILETGFRPHSFIGYGGFIDPFVDRAFGHNLSPHSPDDLFLVRRLGLLNDILLDTGVIKPTIMLARFVKYDGPEIAYRGRTAARSIRPPDAPPTWLAGAQTDFASLADSPSFVFRVAGDGTVIDAKLRAAQHLIDDQAARLLALTSTLEERTAQVDAVHASTSWRMTAGLRWLVRSVRGR